VSTNAPTLTVPRCPEELTASWLTQALRPSAVLVNGSVRSFLIEEIGEGWGFAGQVARVHLTYQEEDAVGPATVIAKFPAREGPTRELAERFGFYEREVRFYQTIGNESGVHIPEVYYSAIGTDGDVVLLLEDLTLERRGDLVQGCSLAEAAAVVDALALMHASWWDNPSLSDLTWLPAPNDESALEIGRQISRPAWEAFLKKAGKHLPEKLIALGDKTNGDTSLLHRLAAKPRTLVHGDIAANNMLFAANREPTFLDWQTVIQGRGPIDVAHFFVTSLQPEDRRTAESELLPRYHQRLMDLGVKSYSFKDCWDDYRLAVMNEFGQIVALSYLIDIGTQLREEVDAATGARPLAALVDLDMSDLISMPTVLDRIRSRLIRAVRLNRGITTK
jgi:hypothetical protein